MLPHILQHTGTKQTCLGKILLQRKALREASNGREVVAQSVLSLAAAVEHCGLVGLQRLHAFARLLLAGIVTRLALRLCHQQEGVQVVGLVAQISLEQRQGSLEAPLTQIHLGQQGRDAAVGAQGAGRHEAFLGIGQFTHLHGAYTVVAQGFKLAFVARLSRAKE